MQLVLDAASRAREGLAEAGAGGADRGTVADATTRKRPFLTAAGADPSGPHRAVRAAPADESVRPAAGLMPTAPASAALGHVPAFVLLVGRVGRAHASGRMRAGRGRSFAASPGGAGRSPGGGLADPGVLCGGGHQLGRGAGQDVAECGHHLQRHPFGGAGDQAVDLGGGQFDAALAEQRNQFGGGVDPVLGHHFAQPPGVADLALHVCLPLWD